MRLQMQSMPEEAPGCWLLVLSRDPAVDILKSVSEDLITGLLSKAIAAVQHRGRKTFVLKDLAYYVVGSTNTLKNIPDLANVVFQLALERYEQPPSK